MFGLLLITLPSFVLGREFSLAWESMTRKLVSVRHVCFSYLSQRPQNADQQRQEHDPEDGPESPIEPTSGRSYHVRIPSLPKDLTNRKLAQNQTELSRQIAELRIMVEAQGRTLEQLLDVLSKGKSVDRT